MQILQAKTGNCKKIIVLSKWTSHSYFSGVTSLVPDIMQCTAQVEELLHPFGLLKAFNLVMDKHTGNSKARSLLSASAHLSSMWSVCMHLQPSE